MARPKKLVPSYLRHSSGQARVLINGKYHYLGKYGSPESKIEYGRLVALMQSGEAIPSKRDTKRPSGLTVGDLVLRYINELLASYKGPRVPSQVSVMRSAVRPMLELYCDTPATDFGPLALAAVRARMIEELWARTTINNQISRIKQIWKWAVSKELIPVECWQRLLTVSGLQKGRSKAMEPEPRKPVSREHIEAVRAEVSPLVRDLIDLQLATGARSGELLALTGAIFSGTGTDSRQKVAAGDGLPDRQVWVARLDSHKTAHIGRERTLHFGPTAQLILTKYLTGNRRTPLFKIGRTGYCRAVTRACERLKIPRWVPHQLRHTHATLVREQFGIEHAQAALGHSSVDMTAHYAQASAIKAAEVAKEIG